jgi:hypothetical protein
LYQAGPGRIGCRLRVHRGGKRRIEIEPQVLHTERVEISIDIRQPVSGLDRLIQFRIPWQQNGILAALHRHRAA